MHCKNLCSLLLVVFIVHNLFSSEDFREENIFKPVFTYVQKTYEIDEKLIDCFKKYHDSEIELLLSNGRSKFKEVHTKPAEHVNLIQGKCSLPYENFFLIKTCNEEQTLSHFMIVQELKE